MRAIQALSKLRIRPWPYPGAIAIRERDAYTERTELHLIDRWRHVGTARTDAELHELAHGRRDAPFDLDTYRALVRLIKAPPRNCEIIVLPA